MSCERQQKPPLPREGFRAHRAVEEKRGYKCLPQKNTWEKEKSPRQKSECEGPYGSYYTRVLKSSERRERLSETMGYFWVT